MQSIISRTSISKFGHDLKKNILFPVGQQIVKVEFLHNLSIKVTLTCLQRGKHRRKDRDVQRELHNDVELSLCPLLNILIFLLLYSYPEGVLGFYCISTY